MLGAGNPPLHRFRVGLEFTLSGHRQLDGMISEHAKPEEILGGLEATPAWQAVIASEPALAIALSPEQLDSALAAIANFVDLKSPFTLGHSVAVADLAEEAGRKLRLPPEQLLALRRAGLVHGFGRLGVSNSIWDRSGPLSAVWTNYYQLLISVEIG